MVLIDEHPNIERDSSPSPRKVDRLTILLLNEHPIIAQKIRSIRNQDNPMEQCIYGRPACSEVGTDQGRRAGREAQSARPSAPFPETAEYVFGVNARVACPAADAAEVGTRVLSIAEQANWGSCRARKMMLLANRVWATGQIERATSEIETAHERRHTNEIRRANKKRS
jgi:hypothetical protein